MKSKTALLPFCMLTGLLLAAGCNTKDKEAQAPQAGATAQIADQPREDAQKPVAQAGDTSIEQTSKGTVVRAGDVSVTLPK